jgi:peptidoglycan/xylan/chitin deacetylase (PgdA/CDA1 family)
VTNYVAAYDTESLRCINGVRSIVKQHKKHNAPATFFIVGELLTHKEISEELAVLLDDPLFEIGSHTFSHELMKQHKFYNNLAPDSSLLKEQIEKTNELIKATFKCNIVGFRTPCGFYNGIKGEHVLQRLLWENGIRYVSSKLMGRGDTVPSELSEPFWYDEDDILRPLLELPAHDWHDNVLKGYNFCPVAWPPSLPWGYPERPPKTPQEEAAIYQKGISYAIQVNATYYSPVLHPWSTYRFNRDAETIELLLSFAETNGMKMMNFGMQYQEYCESHTI